MSKNLLIWLGELYSDEEILVGEKAKILSELIKIDFPVPNGFVITTASYREFLRENKLEEKVSHLKASLTGEKLDKAMQKELATAKVSQRFIDEVFKAYTQLAGQLSQINLRISPSFFPSNVTTKGEANLLIEIKDFWLQAFTKNIKNVSLLVQLNLSFEQEGEIHTESPVSSPSALSQKAQKQLLELTAKAQKHFLIPKTLSWIFSKGELYIVDVKEFTPLQNTALHRGLAYHGVSPATATKIYVQILNPTTASDIAKQHTDGVGLLPAELLIGRTGTHPKKMIEDGKSKEFIDTLAENIVHITRLFSPRPVVYKVLDFTTSEYRQLEGSTGYESVEQNPLLGYRGAYRYNDDPETFLLELEAVKRVRNKLGAKNLWLALPYVRTTEELQRVKIIIAGSGLYRSPTLKIWMMIDVPANVILLDSFIQQGIDGVSINVDSLTTHFLGIDKNNISMSHGFNQQDESVLWAVEHVIKTSHKHNIITSIYGDSLSAYPNLLKHVVNAGISSITVSPDAIDMTRHYIAQFEKERTSK